MRRGTTPLHTFVLPFNTDTLAAVRIVYAQDGEPVLVKTADDCDMSGDKIEVRLTQKETLSFIEDKFAEMQLHVLTLGGEALTSNIVKDYVCRCLDDEVLA